MLEFLFNRTVQAAAMMGALIVLPGCVTDVAQFQQTRGEPPLHPKQVFLYNWLQPIDETTEKKEIAQGYSTTFDNWYKGTNNNGAMTRCDPGYPTAAFYDSSKPPLSFSTCANIVVKQATDVCVYEMYNRDTGAQLANLGLTGVLIASGSAVGLATLFHASGATTTAVTTGAAAVTTAATTAQKAVPTIGSSPISTMQSAANSYIAFAGPSYIIMPTIVNEVENDQDRAEGLQYYCPSPAAIADDTNVAKWSTMTCSDPWQVTKIGPTGDIVRIPSIANYQILQEAGVWGEQQYANFYDAVFSNCPASTL